MIQRNVQLLIAFYLRVWWQWFYVTKWIPSSSAWWPWIDFRTSSESSQPCILPGMYASGIIYTVHIYNNIIGEATCPSGLGRWIWNLEVPAGSSPPPCYYLDLFSVVLSSTPRPHCVNNQLISLPSIEILNDLWSICNICLFIFSVLNKHNCVTVLNTFDFEIKFLLLSTVLLLVLLLLFPFAAVDIMHEHKLNQCDCKQFSSPFQDVLPPFHNESVQNLSYENEITIDVFTWNFFNVLLALIGWTLIV